MLSCRIQDRFSRSAGSLKRSRSLHSETLPVQDEMLDHAYAAEKGLPDTNSNQAGFQSCVKP